MILTDAFWSQVVQDGDCWRWTGPVTTSGYGQWRTGGKPMLTHRLTFTELRDDIPAGLSIDHLCRVRPCCNPWHMDPVTPVVNTHRKYRGVTCRHGVTAWVPCPTCEQGARTRSESANRMLEPIRQSA